MTSIHRVSLITHINDINVECKLNMQKPDDIYPPGQATGLAADQPTGSEQIDLTWNTNPEPDVTRHSVYRKVGDGAFTKIAEIQGTSYTDTALEEYTSYTYAVAAVDRSGNEGDQSSSVGLSTGSFGNPPDEVEDVTATTLSHDEIEVAWTGIEELDMDHYCIYRDGIKVGEVDHPTTTFTDSGLEPETTYSYRVSAVDNEGNEGPLSDPDSATTLAEPVDTSYDGTGKPSDDEIDEYETGLNNAMSNIVSYWTGWWPLLHYEFEVELVPEDVPAGHPAEPMEGKMLYVHQAKNLLGQTEIEEITSEGDGSFGTLTQETQEQLLTIGISIFMLEIEVSASLFEVCANTGNVPGMIISLAACIISIICLHVMMFHMVDGFIETGQWTQWDAAIYYLFLGIITLLAVFGIEAMNIIRHLLFPVSAVDILAETIKETVTGVQKIFAYSKFAQLIMFAVAISFLAIGFCHIIKSL